MSLFLMTISVYEKAGWLSSQQSLSNLGNGWPAAGAGVCNISYDEAAL